jgi:hypothetical protein
MNGSKQESRTDSVRFPRLRIGMGLVFRRTTRIRFSMKCSLDRHLISASLSKVLVIMVAVILQGCSDMGPPPDETARNAPPAPPKQPSVMHKGTPLKVKSIKDRS